MTCAWQETDTVPPVTVHVVTTGAAAAVVAEVVGRQEVRVAVDGLEGSVVEDVSSEVGVGVSVAGTEVCVADAVWGAEDVARVALASSSLSATCGAVSTFVDAPSSNTATARHTTKLVTAVASTHDAAATPAIRRRD
jgi:hypothetical protein